MNNKIISIMLVALMAIAAVSVMADFDTDADTVVAGDVRVQYYDGQSWSSKDVVAFDLYQAVVAANTGANPLSYTLTFAEGAMSWSKVVPNDGNPYTEPNENYGKITGLGNSDSFTVFVYTNAWEIAQPAIGWYRPFTDYAATVHFADSAGTGVGASAGSANIAIVAGTYTSMPSGYETAISLTSVSNYQYTFNLKDTANAVSPASWPRVTYYNDQKEGWYSKTLSASDLRTADGITIRGYGSDAYLALKDALGASVVGQDTVTKLRTNSDGTTYLTYYSWMDSILGSGTHTQIINNQNGTTTYNYTYWGSYTSSGAYLQYTLGYYSGISGAPNSGNAYKLTYELSSWTY